MDANSAKKLLNVQIENALRVLDAGFGVNHAEAIFFDIVRLIEREPALKAHFLSRVEHTFNFPDIGSLCPGMVPGDLIEFIAHEFRWSELQELAKKRVKKLFGGDMALAIGDISGRLDEAFRDDWPDREFYENYKPRIY